MFIFNFQFNQDLYNVSMQSVDMSLKAISVYKFTLHLPTSYPSNLFVEETRLFTL